MKAGFRATLLGVAVIFSSATLEAAPTWTKAETENFRLYTTAGEGQARRTLKLYEQLRGFFLKALNPKKLPTEKTVIIGFRNRKEFEPFKPNDFAAAYYLGGYDRDYIVIGDLGPDIKPVAIHEYVHLLVKHSDLELPIWLNEGLAELYSTLESRGDQVMVGQLVPGRVQVLQRKKWLPLETLLTAGRDSEHYNERNRASVFYSQSWALVHMLNLEPKLRPKLGDLLNALLNGVEPVRAFEATYGMSIEDMRKQLKSYLRQDRFMGALFDVKLAKSALEPTIEPASDLEAGLVLGKLLDSSSKGRESAAAHYLKLEAQHPDNAEIHEALAKIAYRDKDHDLARQRFARAVELGSENPDIYMRYATLLEDDQRDQRIALLVKAVTLRPADAQNRRYLASQLMRAERWLQALIQLRNISKVETREDAFTLYRQRAYACLRLERFDEAQEEIERAEAVADTPEQLDQLLSLQQYLSRSQMRDELMVQAQQRPQPPPPIQPPAGRPKLERRQAPIERRKFTPPPPPPSFEGSLTHFDCLTTKAVLTLQGERETAKFVIEDPTSIVVVSKQGGELEFTCGPQPGRRLRVEYRTEPDAISGAVGVITLIEAY